MDIKRIFRHLLFGDIHVRKRFTPASLERIGRAITETEALHSGELRFAVEASLDWAPLWR